MRPPVGHVTPVRGPCGPDVARRNDADSRHGGPPADGEAAIRLTLISVRRPATGYPPAASGQELLIAMAPLPGTPDDASPVTVAAARDSYRGRSACNPVHNATNPGNTTAYNTAIRPPPP